MSTRQRRKIRFAPNTRCLFGHAANDVRKRDPLLKLFRQHEAAGIRCWLETHTGHPGPLHPELNDPPQLMIVDTWMHGANQNRVQPDASQLLNSLQLRFQQRLTAQNFVTGVTKPVELQIDFGPVLQQSHAFQKLRILRQADTVRVDHYDIDRLIARVLVDFVEVRMNGRFTAGQLQNLRLPLNFHQSINGRPTLFQRQMFTTRSTDREAHRTFQIAAGSNFQQTNARMLLMF